AEIAGVMPPPFSLWSDCPRTGGGVGIFDTRVASFEGARSDGMLARDVKRDRPGRFQMSAVLVAATWKVTFWLAARLAAPHCCPLPLSGVRGQIEALIHSRESAALLAAVALMVTIHAVRRAWFDIYGRWYSR